MGNCIYNWLITPLFTKSTCWILAKSVIKSWHKASMTLLLTVTRVNDLILHRPLRGRGVLLERSDYVSREFIGEQMKELEMWFA